MSAVRRMLLALVLFSVQSPATAKGNDLSLPTDCYDFQNIASVSLPVGGACDEVRYLDGVLNKAKQLTPIGQPELLGLRVYNRPYQSDGRYDPLYQHIQVSMTFGDFAQQENAKKVLLHEYGHHMYFDLLLKRTPKLHAKFKSFWRHRRSFYELLSDRRCEAHGSADCKQLSKEAWNSWFQRRGIDSGYFESFVEGHQAKMSRLQTIHQPYSEVFADFFAAVVSGDPEINVHRTSFPQARGCRSFDASASSFADATAHCYLASLRPTLWAYASGSHQATKSDLLLLVGSALIDAAVALPWSPSSAPLSEDHVSEIQHFVERALALPSVGY